MSLLLKVLSGLLTRAEFLCPPSQWTTCKSGFLVSCMGVKGNSGPTKDWPNLEMIESSSQEPLREEHLEYIQLHIHDPVFGTNISPFERYF